MNTISIGIFAVSSAPALILVYTMMKHRKKISPFKMHCEAEKKYKGHNSNLNNCYKMMNRELEKKYKR